MKAIISLIKLLKSFLLKISFLIMKALLLHFFFIFCKLRFFFALKIVKNIFLLYNNKLFCNQL